MVILAAVASAAELSPVLALPSAVAIEAGSGQAAVGAYAEDVDGGPQVAGTLRAAVGITDRLALNGAFKEPYGGLLLGLRYNVVQTDHVRVAPFLLGAVSDQLVLRDNPEAKHTLAAGGGVAVEAGGPTVRFDMSLPLAVTGISPIANPIYAPFALGAAGCTIAFTPRHVLRVGWETLATPSLTFRYQRERWYLQAMGGYTILRGEALAHGEAGLRF